MIETVKPAFAAAIKKRIAFVTTDWIKQANKRGVDGKAALAYFRAEAEKNK